MRIFTIAALSGLLLTTAVQAQSIYRNGTLSTGTKTKSGLDAPKGEKWSECQNEPGGSYANAVLGYNADIDITVSGSPSFKYYLSDNFTIPAGERWDISKISVYAYKSDPFFIFNRLVMKLCNGKKVDYGPFDPRPEELIYGDLSTNRLTAAIDSHTYRIANTLLPTVTYPTAKNKIFKLVANMPVTNLEAGDYYIVWGIGSEKKLGGYCPPATVVDKRGLPGWDAFYYTPYVWLNADDGGTPSGGNRVNQDFPFDIEYTNTGSLPVNLGMFTANTTNNHITLSWQSLTEQNSKGFEIERSNNGVEFSKLGFVASLGNTETGHSYTWSDNTAQINTKYYYRLRQLDLDGKPQISKVISALLNQGQFSVRLNSSVIRQSVTVTVESREAGKAGFGIISMNGQTIIAPLEKNIMAGASQIAIPVSGLAKGQYKLVVKSRLGNKSFSFIKQ